VGLPWTLGEEESMKNTFVTLWPNSYCNYLKLEKDEGPLEVVYGGKHQAMPSIASVRVGDTMIALSVTSGSLFLMGGMTVSRIEEPFAYLESAYGLQREPGSTWESFLQVTRTQHNQLGHRIPRGFPNLAAVGIWGTEIRFDRKVPEESLLKLRFGPMGKESEIRGLDHGRLTSSVSFAGNVRRASVASSEILEGILSI
jgi:hypothetical protein